MVARAAALPLDARAKPRAPQTAPGLGSGRVLNLLVDAHVPPWAVSFRDGRIPINPEGSLKWRKRRSCIEGSIGFQAQPGLRASANTAGCMWRGAIAVAHSSLP